MRLGIAVDDRIRRVITHDVPAMLVRSDVVRRIERRFPDFQGTHLFCDLLLDIVDPAPRGHVMRSPVMGDAQARLPPWVFHRRVEIEEVRLQRQGAICEYMPKRQPPVAGVCADAAGRSA